MQRKANYTHVYNSLTYLVKVIVGFSLIIVLAIVLASKVHGSTLPPEPLPNYADAPIGGLTQPFTDAQITSQILAFNQDELFVSSNGELIGVSGPGEPYLGVTWSPLDIVVYYTPSVESVPQCTVGCAPLVVTPEPSYGYLVALAGGVIWIGLRSRTNG